MCGIAGFLARAACGALSLEDDVRRMSDQIVHRGPDAAGVWVDATACVALGHRRLAVVDLSPHGQQPMVSVDGRYCMVYNGEIYNHLDLRRDLQGYPWRGHSDTETLLAGISTWGLLDTLSRVVGMFALAVWDRESRTLSLARDRFGEKPLYYGRLDCGDFVFGSELKALRAHPRWHGRLDRNALAMFMRHSAVPGPHCIYSGVRKLPPGSWLEVDRAGHERGGTYWSVAKIADEGGREPSKLSDGEATTQLEQLLVQSVRGQMMADVPIGAFLSGGVDSSTIVALMQANSSSKVRTFAIGFVEEGFNEAQNARAVSRHLGTDHAELYVTATEALNVVPRMANVYDEPFADPSQIPTLLVAELAHRHVTVALSGDAGDEIFAGYNRYLLASRLLGRLERLPLGLRQSVSRLLLGLSPRVWDDFGAFGAFFVPRILQHRPIGDKVHKLAESVLPASSCVAMYKGLVSQWQAPEKLVLGSQEPTSQLDEIRFDPAERSFVDWMCLLDQVTYLPDDILVKVDRAAMASGLETRVPFLDHRIAEFAWRLPLRQRVRNGVSKWLLRQVLYRYVPPSLIDRPKQGFGVPLGQWLRGPLRDWADALLDERRLRDEGNLDVASVRRRWCEHQRGSRNWQNSLWSVLMFQAWLDEQRRPQGLAAS